MDFNPDDIKVNTRLDYSVNPVSRVRGRHLGEEYDGAKINTYFGIGIKLKIKLKVTVIYSANCFLNSPMSKWLIQAGTIEG